LPSKTDFPEIISGNKSQLKSYKNNHHVCSIRHIDFVWGDEQVGIFWPPLAFHTALVLFSFLNKKEKASVPLLKNKLGTRLFFIL
jgi:hypothetical protein